MKVFTHPSALSLSPHDTAYADERNSDSQCLPAGQLFPIQNRPRQNEAKRNEGIRHNKGSIHRPARLINENRPYFNKRNGKA